MNVTLERVLPIGQAFSAARETTLEAAKDEQIYFYKNATLRLENLWPKNLNPVSMYLLRKNLDFQRALRQHLLDRYRIDTLQLSSVLHLRTEKGVVGMIPPYVEISEEKLQLIPGSTDREPPKEQVLRVAIMIDGLHRAWLAKEEGLLLNCIVCSGAYDSNYLYTSYPVHWSQVKIYDEVPKVKKFYRRQDKYSFMRPLEAFRLTKHCVGGEYGR